MMRRNTVLTIAVLSLAGCATRENNPAGVRELLVEHQLQYLDLPAMINAAADVLPSEAKKNLPTQPQRPTKMSSSAYEDARLSQAIAAFYDKYYVDVNKSSIRSGSKSTIPSTGGQASDSGTSVNSPSSEETNLQDVGALMRNDIQDQIIAASNVRCQQWMSYFSTQSAAVGFTTKSIGTVASALATAFTPVDVKSGFSAASSIATGTSANYTEIYLQQKTTSVIFQGIVTRQASLIRGLRSKRFKDGKPAPLQSYTLSQAIADGLAYHAACSLESGLEQASEALAPQQSQKGTQVTQLTAQTNSAGGANNGPVVGANNTQVGAVNNPSGGGANNAPAPNPTGPSAPMSQTVLPPTNSPALEGGPPSGP
jgi:hypothetical protein